MISLHSNSFIHSNAYSAEKYSFEKILPNEYSNVRIFVRALLIMHTMNTYNSVTLSHLQLYRQKDTTHTKNLMNQDARF